MSPFNRMIVSNRIALLLQPIRLPLRVDLLGDVGDLVAHHIFDGVLVNLVSLGRCDKMGPAIMRPVLRVQVKGRDDPRQDILIPDIRQLDIFLSLPGLDPV